jgi:hypothetical protein
MRSIIFISSFICMVSFLVRRLVRGMCIYAWVPLGLWGKLLLLLFYIPPSWSYILGVGSSWSPTKQWISQSSAAPRQLAVWRQHVHATICKHATATKTHAMATKQTWSIYTCDAIFVDKQYIYIKIVFIILETRRTTAETQAQFAPPGSSNIVRFQSVHCNSAVHIWSTTRHQWTISPSMAPCMQGNSRNYYPISNKLCGRLTHSI